MLIFHFVVYWINSFTYILILPSTVIAKNISCWFGAIRSCYLVGLPLGILNCFTNRVCLKPHQVFCKDSTCLWKNIVYINKKKASYFAIRFFTIHSTCIDIFQHETNPLLRLVGFKFISLTCQFSWCTPVKPQFLHILG